MSKFIQNYFSSRVLSKTAILVIDTMMIVFSCMLMYFIRYGFDGLTADIRSDGTTLCLFLIFFNTISFVTLRTFSGILRFSSFTDLMRIVYALVLGYGLTFISVLILRNFQSGFHLDNLTFISIFFLNTFLMIFSRILVKEVYETITGNDRKPVNVFIYGTKEAGISVAKALRGNNELNYRLLAFISDESHMVGKELMGVTIYENNENLFRVLVSKNVRTIIVSPQKMHDIKNSALFANFVDHDISLLTTAPINQWNGTLKSKEQLKDIQIEDLLPRDPININMLEIALNIEGKRVMVTGAAGSIGSEIVRQVASFNPNSIILIDQAETPLHDLKLELKDKWRDLRTEIIVANVRSEEHTSELQSRPHLVCRLLLEKKKKNKINKNK